MNKLKLRTCPDHPYWEIYAGKSFPALRKEVEIDLGDFVSNSSYDVELLKDVLHNMLENLKNIKGKVIVESGPNYTYFYIKETRLETQEEYDERFESKMNAFFKIRDRDLILKQKELAEYKRIKEKYNLS